MVMFIPLYAVDSDYNIMPRKLSVASMILKNVRIEDMFNINFLMNGGTVYQHVDNLREFFVSCLKCTTVTYSSVKIRYNSDVSYIGTCLDDIKGVYHS